MPKVGAKKIKTLALYSTSSKTGLESPTHSPDRIISDPLPPPFFTVRRHGRNLMPPLRHSFMLLLFWWCCLGSSFAKGDSQALYWVSLTDKAGTPFSVLKPEAFLSPRAIQRRANQGISIVESDLPVNPEYLQAVEATGAIVRYQSRWFNTLTILADSLALIQIQQLPFVKEIEYVGRYYRPKNNPIRKRPKFKPYNKTNDYYGYSSHQISMLNGQALHQLGFRGKDKLVAVLDGGFQGVHHSPFYDSIRVANRFYAGKDFVDIDNEVYEASSHGAQVLSTMAANLPGLYVGSAPDAFYTCIKTEDTRGEYLIEECNWVAGAEYADSIGADVMNSSLGYTTFNDTSMNYTYEDLDGRTSRASRAADIAFGKGIIVVNSAGNSGNDAWKYIGTPADAFFVLSIGATDYLGNKAGFSSFGPTPDGRVKPNISAMGQNIAVAAVAGYDVQVSNGTSFSSPLMAGMITSLWSALPDYSNAELVEIVQKAGHLFPNPSFELGYGIPDFLGAFLREMVAKNILYIDGNEFVAVVPEVTGRLQLIIVPDGQKTSSIKIRNAYEEVVWSKEVLISDPNVLKMVEVPQSEKWVKGLYALEMHRDGKIQRILLRM